MIAFYGSTRTYSPVFEHHGYDGLSDRLHELPARAATSKGMTALITDDILDHYIVTAGWDDLADALVERYRDLAPERAAHELHRDQPVPDTIPTCSTRWGAVAHRVRSATS